jgi:hypothetical protein
MSAIDTFITKIRNTPEFVSASAADPNFGNHLEAIESALNLIDRKANDDPHMIEIFDRIHGVIFRDDLSLKQRLIEVLKVFAELRDADGTTH